MLDPHDRLVLFEELRPPDGYMLGEAIATTYSLDLDTLLQAAAAFELPYLEPTSSTSVHAIEFLQAVERVAPRITVFCNATGIDPPGANVIYGLLEQALVHARAPHGGSLHAKLWLIRFDPTGDDLEPYLRLIVLSRNLTQDRSWDVSVVLDGELRTKRKVNNPLVALLEKLPSCAVSPLSDAARTRLARLGEQLSRAEWDVPSGFEELSFHVLGIGPRPRPWLPVESDRLVVISPFLSAPALEALLDSTAEPVAIIGRAEEFDRCSAAVTARFGAVQIVNDAATLSDGEDPWNPDKPHELRGLHAKAYIAKVGKNTHVYAGSANATATALVHGLSIEVMVELSGRTSGVPGKGIDGLFSSSGFGALLQPYTPAENGSQAPSPNELALRAAAAALAVAGLTLRYDAHGDEYVPVLMPRGAFVLPGVARVSAWVITSDASTARPLDPLLAGNAVPLAHCEAAGTTALVGFRLQAGTSEDSSEHALVLCLPTMSLPEHRDAHIVRKVIGNEARLVQYLRGLLQEPDVLAWQPSASGGESNRADGHGTAANGAGLLEDLIRAKTRDPERFADALDALHSLTSLEQGSIVSTELLEVWRAVSSEGRP